VKDSANVNAVEDVDDTSRKINAIAIEKWFKLKFLQKLNDDFLMNYI